MSLLVRKVVRPSLFTWSTRRENQYQRHWSVWWFIILQVTSPLIQSIGMLVNGFCHHFEILSGSSGQKVVIDVIATYGVLQATTQTFFLPWW